MSREYRHTGKFREDSHGEYPKAARATPDLFNVLGVPRPTGGLDLEEAAKQIVPPTAQMLRALKAMINTKGTLRRFPGGTWHTNPINGNGFPRSTIKGLLDRGLATETDKRRSRGMFQKDFCVEITITKAGRMAGSAE